MYNYYKWVKQQNLRRQATIWVIALNLCAASTEGNSKVLFSHVVFVQASVSEYNGVCLRVNVCVSVCVRVFLSLCESVGACVRV